jgi:aryl-alcohol dehydrogenase-like predicted oxidoreductase
MSEALAVIDRALDHGVNYVDTVSACATSLDYYGAALGERRSGIFLASTTSHRTRDGSLWVLGESRAGSKPIILTSRSFTTC